MTPKARQADASTRAIQQCNLWAAETALGELGHPPTLEYALAYLDLLAEDGALEAYAA